MSQDRPVISFFNHNHNQFTPRRSRHDPADRPHQQCRHSSSTHDPRDFRRLPVAHLPDQRLVPFHPTPTPVARHAPPTQRSRRHLGQRRELHWGGQFGRLLGHQGRGVGHARESGSRTGPPPLRPRWPLHPGLDRPPDLGPDPSDRFLGTGTLAVQTVRLDPEGRRLESGGPGPVGKEWERLRPRQGLAGDPGQGGTGLGGHAFQIGTRIRHKHKVIQDKYICTFRRVKSVSIKTVVTTTTE